jgi:hypothetical protein
LPLTFLLHCQDFRIWYIPRALFIYKIITCNLLCFKGIFSACWWHRLIIKRRLRACVILHRGLLSKKFYQLALEIILIVLIIRLIVMFNCNLWIKINQSI